MPGVLDLLGILDAKAFLDTHDLRLLTGVYWCLLDTRSMTDLDIGRCLLDTRTFSRAFYADVLDSLLLLETRRSWKMRRSWTPMPA
jgi:hypothetical protein